MRSAMLWPAVLGLAGSLWAADPFVGTWEFKIAKSKFPPGTLAPSKKITGVTPEAGDQLEVTNAGTQTDGSPLATRFTDPQKGGILTYQDGGPAKPQTIVIGVISPFEW